MANLSSFDLNLLRVLDALLVDKSTVRAAERLGLSQPAVSAALSRLRGALGDDLLFRRGQGMEPTQYALSLAGPLRDILGQVELLIRDNDGFDPAQSDARFRISGSDFFAELLMPDLGRRLQEVAPGMSVHLVDLVRDDHIATLDRYEVDFVLAPQQVMPDWVEGQLVAHSSFSVIAQRGHPRLCRAGLARWDVMPLDLFCDLGHVLFSPEGNAKGMGDAALARVGRKRHVVMSLPVFSGVYRAVARSDLVALLPTGLAQHVADREGLEIYRAPVSIPRAPLFMAWHKRYAASRPHEWIRAQIAEVLKPLDEGPDG